MLELLVTPAKDDITWLLVEFVSTAVQHLVVAFGTTMCHLSSSLSSVPLPSVLD
jgi:hypothetical protein